MFDFFARSILRRLLAALLSIYLVTYVATAVVVYSGVRSSLLQSDAASLNHLAELKYEQLSAVVAGLARDLSAWSELEVMNDLVSGDVDKRVTLTLEALKRLYGFEGNIYAFDTKGILLASTQSGITLGREFRLPGRWLDKPQTPAFIEKDRDPITNDDVMVISTPVFASFDHTYRIGTLVVTESWSALVKLLPTPANETLLLDTRGGGTVLATNPGDLAAHLPLPANQLVAGPQNDTAALVVGRSTSQAGIVQDWRVVMVHNAAAATRPLRSVALKLLLLGVFLGIPIVFLGRWLSHRLTAPIADLTRVVSKIADTDKLDSRAPVTSADELGSLARSFNQMTDSLQRATREREAFVQELATLNQSLESKIADRTEELEAALRAQRRLIADISHEIKSPLARLSMALGLASRSPGADQQRHFDRIEREIGNISTLASELLTLARLDAVAAAPEFAPVQLNPLIEQILEDAAYESPARARDISFQGESVWASMNADLLRRAIENVVRNAIFYTAENTPIEVVLIRTDHGTTLIQVADHGPGVPAEALGHLFEPFYRVDAARARQTGGAGVGLAITQRVVELHKGTIRARSNKPHGLIVEIELPMDLADTDSFRMSKRTRRRAKTRL